MVSLEGTKYWETERLRSKFVHYNYIWMRNHNNPQSMDFVEEALSDVVLPDENEFCKDKQPEEYSDMVEQIGKFVIKRFAKSNKSARAINKNLLDFYDKNRPTTSTISAQKIVFDLLQKVISKVHPDARLFKYGSSANGLATNTSDLDLTLIFESPQLLNEVTFLNNLSVALKAKIPELESVETISGNHPILIMIFQVNGMMVSVDLSVQNHKTVLNSYIIRQYTRIDHRFAIVFGVIKRWAQTNQLFGGSKHSFNSYSLALLVIQFLQSGIKPAVLPYLNEDYPELFAEGASVNDICVNRDLNSTFERTNQMTVLQLVAGFLLFYYEYEFEKYMPSILDPIHHNRFNDSTYYYTNPIIMIDPCLGCNPTRGVSFITFIQFKRAIRNFVRVLESQNNKKMATKFNIMFGTLDEISAEDLEENSNLRIQPNLGFLQTSALYALTANSLKQLVIQVFLLFPFYKAHNSLSAVQIIEIEAFGTTAEFSIVSFGRLIKILVPVYSDYSTNQQISQDRYSYLFGAVPRRMTASFDENNPKYWVFFKKLHIRVAARGVSIALLLLVAIHLIQSFRHSTAVILYSWLAACFAIGIYASLMYGVFKEKRLFVMPFLIFQAVLVAFLSITLFIFTASALFSLPTLKKFGRELGSIDEKASEREQDSQLRGFVVYFYIMLGLALGVQLWFMEIIYRFFHFLKERETCFNFNLENEFQLHD